MSLMATTHVVLTDGSTQDFYGLKKLIDGGYTVNCFGMNEGAKLEKTPVGSPILGDLSVLIQFRLSTGDVVECTADQEFYMDPWTWVRADTLKVSDRPLVQLGGDIRITHVAQVNGQYQVGSATSGLGNYLLASGLLAKNI